mgnify:CR=1 FL=1
MKKAAKSVGEKSVEMIHVKDINAITGYIRGGCRRRGGSAGGGGVFAHLFQQQNKYRIFYYKIGANDAY